jgi:hypothetical protein
MMISGFYGSSAWDCYRAMPPFGPIALPAPDPPVAWAVELVAPPDAPPVALPEEPAEPPLDPPVALPEELPEAAEGRGTVGAPDDDGPADRVGVGRSTLLLFDDDEGPADLVAVGRGTPVLVDDEGRRAVGVCADCEALPAAFMPVLTGLGGTGLF